MTRIVNLALLMFFMTPCFAGNEIYYRDLRHHYYYDNTLPLDAKVNHVSKDGSHSELIFRSHDGEIIHASVTLPPGYRSDKQYPLYLGDSTLPGAKYLEEKEFIQADISLRLQGKGIHPGLSNSDGSAPFATIWARQNAVIDYRRLLDFIKNNYSVDNNRVIAGGRSRMGRIVTILAANDPRVTGVIAASTSSDWLKTVKTTQHSGFRKILDQAWFTDDFYQQIMAPIDPKYFARYVQVPVLILHGMADEIVTIDGAQRLKQALGSQATIITYPGAGHALRLPEAVADTDQWLTQQFFP